MKRIQFIIGVALAFMLSQASAQTRFSSLQEVWAYADTRNIQLQTAGADKASASVAVKQSYSALQPSLSVNGSFTDNMTIQPTLIPANLFNPAIPAGTFTEATFGRRYIYNMTTVAQLDILNLPNWFNVKSAKLSNEIAGLQMAKTRATLYEQIANCYYTYLLLSEAEVLSRENLRASDTSLALANNRFMEGLISEITLNTARINQEKAQKSVDISVQNKILQLNTLNTLLNTRDSIVLTEKTDYTIPVPLAGDFAADPSVALSETQMALAKNKWKSTKAAFAPVLSGVYQYNTQVAGDAFLKFANSSTLPQQYWGLRLSMPIFSGNTRKYNVQKAKIDYDLTQKELDNAKLQADITNKNISVAYSSALNSYLKSKEILQLYQSNDIHALRKLEEGVISLDERLKVYADLIANQNEYLQSLSDYLIQQYRLKIRQTDFTK